jgi:hypothetical protein
MKLKSVFVFILLVAISAASCKKPEVVNPTSITLDNTTLTVEVGKTSILIAKVEPLGVEATVVWNSLDSQIATVTEGVVTGAKAGKTVVTASVGTLVAVCSVTVVEEGVTPPPDPNDGESLKGSSYYVLFLDETSYSSIASKVIADLRIDEATSVMDIWPMGESYTAVDPSGPNFYGEVAGWISLKSNPAPWGGTGAGGIRQMKNFDMSGIDGTYTFHCAYKSRDGGTNEICLFSQDGQETWFRLPAASDGEWKEFEMPMSTIIAQGWNFSLPYVFSGDGRYSLGFRSSPANTHLNLDAVFIYKKK